MTSQSTPVVLLMRGLALVGIVPVVAAAVDSLGIRAVSEPVTATLVTLLAAVPLLFVAGNLAFGLGGRERAQRLIEETESA